MSKKKDLLDRIEAVAHREVTKLEEFSASDVVLDHLAIDKLKSLVQVISLARQEARIITKELKALRDEELFPR